MVNSTTSTWNISFRFEKIVLAVLFLWLILIQFFQWPVLVNGGFDNRDCAVYAFAGEMVRHGGIPYIDFWDQKPPLIYFINAITLEIFGGQVRGIWVVNLLFLIAALFLCHVTLRRWIGAGAAIIGSVIFAISIVGVYSGGNMTESYALPLQWAIIYAFVRWQQSENPKPFLFGITVGVLTALCFMLRQNLVGTGVAVALTAILYPEIKHRLTSEETRLGKRAWLNSLKLSSGGIAGVALIFIPILIYLKSTGSFNAFLECAFRYNFSFKTSTSILTRLYDHLPIFDYIPAAGLAVAAWVIIIVISYKKRKAGCFTGTALLLIIWLPLELAFATVSRQSFNHYYLTLLPAVSTLLAIVTTQILFNGKSSVKMKRGWVALLVILIAFTVIKHHNKIIRDLKNDRVLQVAETVRYIRENTESDEYIFVWGVMTDVYLFSERPPASRFTLVYPLLAPGYADSTQVRELLSDLKTSSPKLIVDASKPNRQIPPLDDWNPGWKIYGSPVNPALKEFYRFIKAEYEPALVIGEWKWMIWKRKK